MTLPQLVHIEWEDSTQPLPGWRWLADCDEFKAHRCQSVGWLVHDDDRVKAVAANISGDSEKGDIQISGLMRIPARCVLRITPMAFLDPALSSRPARGQTRQARAVARELA
jgi:hypothetical protein